MLARLIKSTDSVDISVLDKTVTTKGKKGCLSVNIHRDVNVLQHSEEIELSSADSNKAMLGTMFALVNNAIAGVSKGYSKKLELRGVGYRVQLKGNTLHFNLGYSHPIIYDLPEEISADVTKQTEIIIHGIDKQLVGQVAAKIRSFRKVEPYKGKGVRYADEYVVMKDTKKK